MTRKCHNYTLQARQPMELRGRDTSHLQSLDCIDYWSLPSFDFNQEDNLSEATMELFIYIS